MPDLPVLPADTVIINIPIDFESENTLVVLRLVRANWWSTLSEQTDLVTTRETATRYLPRDSAPVRNMLTAGAKVKYWGQESGGYLLVYKGAFELWVKADDLRTL